MLFHWETYFTTSMKFIALLFYIEKYRDGLEVLNCY